MPLSSLPGLLVDSAWGRRLRKRLGNTMEVKEEGTLEDVTVKTDAEPDDVSSGYASGCLK